MVEMGKCGKAAPAGRGPCVPLKCLGGSFFGGGGGGSFSFRSFCFRRFAIDDAPSTLHQPPKKKKKKKNKGEEATAVEENTVDRAPDAFEKSFVWSRRSNTHAAKGRTATRVGAAAEAAKVTQAAAQEWRRTRWSRGSNDADDDGDGKGQERPAHRDAGASWRAPPPPSRLLP